MFKDKVKIVEVSKRPNIELTPELKASVLTLPAHPGFHYLVNKLRLQRAALERTLKTQKFEKLSDVEFVQSGIFWTNWLDNQISLLTANTPSSIPTDALAAEEEVIREFERDIRVVA